MHYHHMDCFSPPCNHQLWTISLWRLPPKLPCNGQFLPEEGSTNYKELKTHPDKAFLKTFTSQLEAVLGISLVEILSRHSSDEIYLGQRDSLDWTSDKSPLAAFERFGKKLEEIKDRITKRN